MSVFNSFISGTPQQFADSMSALKADLTNAEFLNNISQPFDSFMKGVFSKLYQIFKYPNSTEEIYQKGSHFSQKLFENMKNLNAALKELADSINGLD